MQAIVQPTAEVFPIFISAPLLILFDGIYRYRNAQFLGRKKWFTSAAGGFVALIPVWIWGIGLLIYAVISLTTSGFG